MRFPEITNPVRRMVLDAGRRYNTDRCPVCGGGSRIYLAESRERYCKDCKHREPVSARFFNC